MEGETRENCLLLEEEVQGNRTWVEPSPIGECKNRACQEEPDDHRAPAERADCWDRAGGGVLCLTLRVFTLGLIHTGFLHV